jgi:subtilisin-like proprotein convertase family protein/subtilisin family serine protease
VSGLPRTYVFRVTSQAQENPIKVANRLLASDQVLASEPNIVVPEQSFHMPSDTLFPEQWHLHHAGGPFLAAESHIDAVRAWDIERGKRSVVVAVADDSVDLNHTDFQGEGKIVAARDFAGRDFDPLPEAADDNHGTACAGVAVAEESGQGVVGVAPGCALMPIRTSGWLDDNSIEDLFAWVITQGASVVSCSWGAAAINFPLSLRQTNALHQAATLGRNGRGCVIVFAAGNSNRPVNGIVDEQGWPNDEPKGPTRWHGGFAAHPDVIAVAASTSLAKKSAYSNWGPEISVCAPSNNAPPDTYPVVTTSLSGRGIVTTDRVGPSGYASTDYTRGFGGTSSACPTVAGVAALVLSANPQLTAREVKDILESTADKIVDPNPDPQLQQALGTYDQQNHSAWFGYGKVNAFKAVTEAVRRQGGVPPLGLRRTSTPELGIPDHNATGVRDMIHFAEAGSVVSVKMHVNLSHPYIGDLRLTLTAPSGTSVVLHDRAGGSTRDIKRTFDSMTTPGLHALAGQVIQGDWALQVQDLAQRDVGVLHRWELEVEGRTDSLVQLEESVGVSIPDHDPNGIQRTLQTAESGQVRELEVTIDITHTYIGDLSVALLSPSGTSATLHHRAGRGTDNLIRTYTLATTPELQRLQGESIQGAWTLKVVDLEGSDVGKLNRWAMKIVRES